MAQTSRPWRDVGDIPRYRWECSLPQREYERLFLGDWSSDMPNEPKLTPIAGRVTISEGGRVIAWEPDYVALRRLMKELGLTFLQTTGPLGNPCWEVRHTPSDAPGLGGQTPVLSGDEPMLGGDRRESSDIL